MATIKKGTTQYDGVIEIDGNLACEGCKTVNPSGQMVMHMDGKDFYSTVYKCGICGNQISVMNKRSKKDRAYWS